MILLSNKKPKLFDYFKLLKKYNTLENKHQTLIQAVKDDVFKDVIENLNYKQKIFELKKDIKKLKSKNKKLRELVKEVNASGNRTKKKRN